MRSQQLGTWDLELKVWKVWVRSIGRVFARILMFAPMEMTADKAQQMSFIKIDPSQKPFSRESRTSTRTDPNRTWIAKHVILRGLEFGEQGLKFGEHPGAHRVVSCPSGPIML